MAEVALFEEAGYAERCVVANFDTRSVTEIIVHFAGFMVYDEKFEEKVQVVWGGSFV